MRPPVLVMVDNMRAVRRTRGAHVRIDVGNVAFGGDGRSNGRSVRLTINIDGVDCVVQMTQADARDLARRLLEGADEARAVDVAPRKPCIRAECAQHRHHDGPCDDGKDYSKPADGDEATS